MALPPGMREASGIAPLARHSARRRSRLPWLLASGVCLSCARCQSPPDPVGKKLYEGELPLVGRLAGDETVLPTVATRCANCHPRSESPDDGGAPAFGPPLTPAALTVPRR